MHPETKYNLYEKLKNDIKFSVGQGIFWVIHRNRQNIVLIIDQELQESYYAELKYFSKIPHWDSNPKSIVYVFYDIESHSFYHYATEAIYQKDVCLFHMQTITKYTFIVLLNMNAIVAPDYDVPVQICITENKIAHRI